jgi:hypothetical protein
LTATARARESNAVVSNASRVIQLAMVAGQAATSAERDAGIREVNEPAHLQAVQCNQRQ